MNATSGLPPLPVASRTTSLRERLAADRLDALVVTDRTNVRYLTGFTGSNATLVVTASDQVLITDGRYDEQSRMQLEASAVRAERHITRDTEEAIVAATAGAARVALEAENVSWAMQRTLVERTTGELVPSEGVVLGLRSVKDPAEIARLEAAAAIADDALAAVRRMLLDGPTERDVARALEAEMVRRGADGPSFETIVASGPNAARPHARPSNRRIGESGAGEFVVIDFGALVDGYHSDMTRTLVVGSLSAPQQRMYEVVAAAQSAGRDAVRAGVQASGIDAVCRASITDAGHGDDFVHGTGHGIGLEIHEAPAVSSQSTALLAAGHCITVEPGVYVPDLGGVRIEDSLVVTATGSRLLTHAPYDPSP